MHLLYGSRGLNKVALGNFAFFQYSSEGEPHSLYILWSCSTYGNNKTTLNARTTNNWILMMDLQQRTKNARVSSKCQEQHSQTYN